MKSDLDLVSDFLAGDERAFETLVRRYQKSIYFFALRWVGRHEDADEMAQVVFIKAYRGLRKFRRRSSFKTWLYRIAINACKNFLRDRSRISTVDIETTALKTETKDEERLIQDEHRRRLRAMMGELPERQRTTTMLRIYEELSFEEIAEVMDCSVGTAKANFHHAIRKLEKLLSDEDQGERK